MEERYLHASTLIDLANLEDGDSDNESSTTFGEDDEATIVNVEEEIINILEKQIEDKKSNLEEVISNVEKRYKRFTACDAKIITLHYISICERFWKNEVRGYLKQTEGSKDLLFIKNMLGHLQNCQNLSNLHELFKNGTYYKLLMNHYENVSKESEESLIYWYRIECYDFVKNSKEEMKNEVIFLEATIDFLQSFKSMKSTYLLMALKEFCFGKISMDDLIFKIENIVDHNSEDSLRSLQLAASKLTFNKNLYLENEFKAALDKYLEPMKVTKKSIDARSIMEITGTYIVVSDCLKGIETILLEESAKGLEVHEIYFVGLLVVHIDTDIESKIWHGRNIVVFTRTIIVHGSVTWNVSGYNAVYEYSKAGTNDEGDGIHGQDGYPGESGGNVLFVADQIENGTSLKIISNGGNGSKGQNGGDGRDGRNGTGITENNLKKRFPPVTCGGGGGNAHSARVKKMIKNIQTEAKTVNIAWINGSTMSIPELVQKYVDQITLIADIYIKAETAEGNVIHFSLDSSWLIDQTLFLYKGSNGTLGQIGGNYGLGGKGGFAGEILIETMTSNYENHGIETEARSGIDGSPGEKGINGKHGKNGWDMGYLDYLTWGEVKRYGTTQDKMLTITVYNESSSSNIYSAFYGKYLGLSVTKTDPPKQLNFKENTLSTCAAKRQHNALAVNKKTLTKQSVLAMYSDQMNCLMDNSIAHKLNIHQNAHNLESMVNKINETLVEEKRNINHQRLDFKTTHLCKYFLNNKLSIHDSKMELISSNSQDPVDMNDLIANLTERQSSIYDWLHITNIQFDSSDTNRLVEAIKKRQVLGGIIKNTEHLKIIQSILDEKYRLASLSNIAENVPIYLNITGDIKIQADSAKTFLTLRNTFACSNDHHSITTLKQYLWDENTNQREKVIEYCAGIKQDKQLWRLLLKHFFEEIENPAEKIKHLHYKYHFYAQKINQNFIVFKESLEKQEMDCQGDSNLMEELGKYLLEKGPFLKTYRFLLANMLNVNIRTYVKDRDDETKFSLNDDFNPQSNAIIYVLLTEDGLTELCIDKARLELEVERQLRSQLFVKILSEVEPLREKEDFDKYLIMLSSFIERINNLQIGDLDKIETIKKKLSDKVEKNLQSYNILSNTKFVSFEDLSKEESFYTHKTMLSCPDILNACEYTGLYLDQMEDLTNIMDYFTEESEKEEITQKFHKISRYIGYPEIVHNIERRFSCEGRHVSYEEISCFINSAISTFIDHEQHLNILSWIVAAYSQKKWIDELVLLKIEDHLKIQIKSKNEWRAYLSKVEDKKHLMLLYEKLESLNPRSALSYQCFADILYVLSRNHCEPELLESFELSEWSYVLREHYWMLKFSTLIGSQADGTSDHLYYLLSIENTYGNELTEKLVQSLQEVARFKPLQLSKLNDILCNFHNEKWILTSNVIKFIKENPMLDIDKWINSLGEMFEHNENYRSMHELIELIKSNGNSSKNITDTLSAILTSTTQNTKIKHTHDNAMEKTKLSKDDIKKCAKSIRDAIREGSRTVSESLIEMLHVIDKAIELVQGYTLRDTQKLAILSLTTNSRNTLAQVSTGEGKSLIVVATAIINAFQNKKVHIITSSSVLAKRDAEQNKQIFNIFDIYASHNCNEDIEKRKQAYSNNQVIYGDLSNFQRDYLLHQFYGKRVLGDHDFDNVIIDEVDSMLLDKGNNMLYLSHNLAGFEKLEPIYIFIWQWINRPATTNEQFAIALDTSAIKEALLDEMYIIIHKSDINELHSKLNEQEKFSIWSRLLHTKIIDDRGKVLKEKVTAEDIAGIVPSNLEYASLVSYRLQYILSECIDRVRSINIPLYLQPFVEQHLECWISSAVTAFLMKSGEDYVVDLDNTNTSQDRNPNIIIIDRDTGTDLVNSQWDEALYQFLQLKHGCKLSLQNLKAVFISNVSYFKKYKTLNGLSGTLGTQMDRDLLQEIHGVDYVIIPTAKMKLFQHEISVLCTTKEDWKNQILKEAQYVAIKQKRSVLIICETVTMVNELYTLFGGCKATYVHTYTRDYEEFQVINGASELNPGQIIIATNLAGRGTDIKISKELQQAGGLHVLLSYLPKNIRIEQQAFGRAARNGAKGSGKLIIFNVKIQQSVCTKILELKKNRHIEEMNRLGQCKLFYDVQIITEEQCFEKFNVEYERLKNQLEDKQLPKDLQTILLDSCLDAWAFWLDKHSKWISISHSSMGKTKYQSALKTFIQDLKSLSTGATECSIFDKINPNKILKKFVYDSKCWSKWVKNNPPQMVKLGKYLSQNYKEFENAHATALELFDTVIQMDPSFSEVARYYKASVLIKKAESGGENIISSVKKELRLAAKLIEQRIRTHSKAASIIANIKMKNSETLIQINAFEDQQRHFIELYNEFITSIDNALGYPVSPECFISQNPMINKQLANTIFETMLINDVLISPVLCKNLPEEDFKTLCVEYGVSKSLLQNTLNGWGTRHINEQDFTKFLELHISLPNRRQFWEMLVQKNVICINKEYVTIEKESDLEGIDGDFIKSLGQQIKKEDKEKILNLAPGQLLYADWTDLEKDNGLLFEKVCFKTTAAYQMPVPHWDKLGAWTFNLKGNVNIIENVRFDAFDSIRADDFANVGIISSEAKEIIAELVKQKILVKISAAEEDEAVYMLNSSLAKINEEQLTFFGGYKEIVMQLLSHTFAYRIAFEAIQTDLKENKIHRTVNLVVDPHRKLMIELFERNIITPTYVNSNLKDLIKTVENIYDRSSLPNNTKIREHISNTIMNFKSTLSMLEIPDGSLKSMPESVGRFAEQKIFMLNGLDCLLQFEEKKWSTKMIYDTFCLSCMAVGQIAFGIVTLPNVVGSNLISEGVNDFIFAIQAMQTGYFSWKNYFKQKLRSILITVCTAGLLYAVKRCFKVLRYGMKVCKKFFFNKVNKEKIAKLTVPKEIESFKKVILGAAGRIGWSIGNSAIENIVETHLQSLCKEIGSSITSDINITVESHHISSTLRKAFDALGEAEARQIINNCTMSCFNKNSDNIYKSFMIDVGKNFIQSCIMGLGKTLGNKKICNNPGQFISTLSSLVTWSDRVYNLREIGRETKRQLDDLDTSINEILKNHTNLRKDVPGKQNNTAFDNFRKDIIDQWKMSFDERASRAVQTYLVTPLLQSAASYLTESVIKLARYSNNRIRAYKEKRYRAQFEKLKREYKEGITNLDKLKSSSLRTLLKNQKNTLYHESILKLMMKTRNPNLMADLVKENVPMDLTCVAACPALLKSITKENIKIVVEGPDGKDRTFQLPSSSSDDAKVIRLKLKDNHFTLCQESITQNGEFYSFDNSCLYNALMQAIPEMKMSPSEFRNKIADGIRKDPAIRRSIEKGYHNKLLAKGFYGGRANEYGKFNVDDVDSSDFLTSEYNDKKSFDKREIDAHKHFYRRFLLTLCFMGAIDGARSEHPELKFIVVGGKSVGQDQNSGRGAEKIDAAHLVRIGGINEQLEGTIHWNILKNMSYHTENVHQWFNRSAVPKNIDTLQSTLLENSPRIIVNGRLTRSAARELKIIKKRFITTLENGIKNDSKNKMHYKQAISDIKKTDMASLVFDGYNQGPKTAQYMRDTYNSSTPNTEYSSKAVNEKQVIKLQPTSQASAYKRVNNDLK